MRRFDLVQITIRVWILRFARLASVSRQPREPNPCVYIPGMSKQYDIHQANLFESELRRLRSGVPVTTGAELALHVERPKASSEKEVGRTLDAVSAWDSSTRRRTIPRPPLNTRTRSLGEKLLTFEDSDTVTKLASSMAERAVRLADEIDRIDLPLPSDAVKRFAGSFRAETTGTHRRVKSDKK